MKKSTERCGKDDARTVRAVDTLGRISRCIAVRETFYWWAPRKLLNLR